MWRSVLFCLVTVLLAACQRELMLTGETGTVGSVVLLAEFPGIPEKVRLDSCTIEQGSWELRAPGVVLPARIWIATENGDTCSLIADKYRGITLTGRFPDSLVVTGSRLEREFGMVRQLLVDRYQTPVEAIREQMELIRRKPVQTKSDRQTLESLKRNLERYRKYEACYLEKLVQTNPKHELSLFILKDVVEDPVVKQELLEIIHLKNRKSNIFQLLTSCSFP